MTTAQFIVLGLTGVTAGKKLKMYITKRKTSDATFTGTPTRPSVHRRSGSFPPRKRLSSTQPIHKVYEVMPLAKLRENIAVRATLEPRLMRESKIVTASEMSTAFSGISQPSFTWPCQFNDA